MSLLKDQLDEIVAELPEDAEWNDLVRALYKHKKITLGLTDLEIAQGKLSDEDIASVMARLQSSSYIPDDKRNTKTYNPGNQVTMGMLAGVVALLFSFVFPPIAWVAAGIAAFSGVLGLKNSEEKAWIPILLAAVSLIPILTVLG